MQQNEPSMSDSGSHLVIRPLTSLGNQKSAACRLTFSPNGKMLVSDGEKTCFWYEDAEANWQLRQTSSGALLQMNLDQTFLLLFMKDGYLERIELQDSIGTCLQTISCSHMRQKYVYGYSPDQKWFLTYDEDGWMYFWDAETLRFETRFLLVPTTMRIHYIGSVRFTPDGKRLFFQNGGFICCCQFSSDPPAIFPEGYLFGHPQWQFCAENFTISPRGEMVALAHTDSNMSQCGVNLYEIASLRHLVLLPVEYPIFLDFSPDGKYLACIDDESRVFLWNISTRQLEQTFISHPGPLMEQMPAVASLAWSPRGDIIAIGGSLYEINDYTIKIWKVEYIE